MIKIVEDFKDRFNKALSMRNMRPVELKEKTGISESAISQYRSGYAKPKQDKLYLIAKALDVSETWLMGLDVPMETGVISTQAKLPDDKYIEIIQAYSKASPDVQKAVELILKANLPDS